MEIQKFEFTAVDKIEEIGLTQENFEIFGKTKDEIVRNIKENFDFVKPEHDITVQRFLTEDEINEARENILDIVENRLPEYEAKYNEAKALAAEIINEAKGLLNSYISQYKEIAKYVRLGTDEVKLQAKDIFRIAFNGFFIYLLVLENSVKVVKIVQIPENELEKWPNQIDLERSKKFFENNKTTNKEE